MHPLGYQQMLSFAVGNIHPIGDVPLRIMDLGSWSDGPSTYTYKSMFTQQPSWEYVGVDIQDGYNVDVVLEDPYVWNELEDDSFDVVISGQCLEHVEFPWLTIKEIARVMKNEALCCIIVPSVGPVHAVKECGIEGFDMLDCYRYKPHGMMALAKWAELIPLYISIYTDEIGPCGEENIFDDITFVGMKTDKQLSVEELLEMRRLISMPDVSEIVAAM